MFKSILRPSNCRPIITSLQFNKYYYSSYALKTLGGEPGSGNYRLYLQDKETLKPLSFFHDVPLRPPQKNNDDVFNMVVEIPRWTNPKLEINKDLIYNPIIQDTKKGKPRFVPNVFPFKGYMHNYGALPQTWEDPNEKCEHTGNYGDNDPIDVCEIGQLIGYTGQIKQVKVLGILALLDEGETDWKVIALDTSDPLSNVIDNIQDVEKYMPGYLAHTRNWFRDYKLPDGKPANEFGLDGEFMNKNFALDIINQTSKSWGELIQKSSDNSGGIAVTNTTLNPTPGYTEEASEKDIPDDIIPQSSPKTLNLDLDKWHFV